MTDGVNPTHNLTNLTIHTNLVADDDGVYDICCQTPPSTPDYKQELTVEKFEHQILELQNTILNQTERIHKQSDTIAKLSNEKEQLLNQLSLLNIHLQDRVDFIHVVQQLNEFLQKISKKNERYALILVILVTIMFVSTCVVYYYEYCSMFMFTIWYKICDSVGNMRYYIKYITPSITNMLWITNTTQTDYSYYQLLFVDNVIKQQRCESNTQVPIRENQPNMDGIYENYMMFFYELF